MRHLFTITLACIIANLSLAQTPTLQQKLNYTCKVWGFVKYYHSNVSTCHVNWDSVLLSVLPAIRNAANDSEFNNAIDTMLMAAGPMTLSTTYFPDTLPTELKRNRNFNWINDTVFRRDVQTILDTIKNNFRPHDGCWVTYDTVVATATRYNGFLLFPNDMPLFDTNTYLYYPNANHRQLMIFKYWNIINYFNPYNYVLDKPIDSMLFNNVVSIDTVSNDATLFNAITRMTSGLDDAHAEVLTYSNLLRAPIGNVPAIMLLYVQGKYIVVQSSITAIPVGDAILSVDGLTTAGWEDSLINYVSAGSARVFHRFMCALMISGGLGTTTKIVYADTSGIIDSTTVIRNNYWSENFYPADSLANILWDTMTCGIGYVNCNNLTISEADSAYAALKNDQAIIVDLRGPTAGNGYELAEDMVAGSKFAAKFTVPDITYPGTFYWDSEYIANIGNPDPYTGTVILLINEYTQSHTEFDCMVFNTLPHVIKIGNSTAGADGNISYCNFSQDIYSGFTNLGTFYPNGDSTQRIGIVPDSIVLPTIAGIMAGRDEVLEKALQVGCSLVNAVPKVVSNSNIIVKAYPNPTDDILNISITNMASDKITMQIQDITGRVLMEKTAENPAGDFKSTLNLQPLATGLYNLCLIAGERKYYVKVVKE